MWMMWQSENRFLFIIKEEIKAFCSEFTRIYNLETDYDKLTNEENIGFRDLCEMAERFSDDLDELKIPHMYFSENEIVEKAKKIYYEKEKW